MLQLGSMGIAICTYYMPNKKYPQDQLGLLVPLIHGHFIKNAPAESPKEALLLGLGARMARSPEDLCHSICGILQVHIDTNSAYGWPVNCFEVPAQPARPVHLLVTTPTML